MTLASEEIQQVPEAARNFGVANLDYSLDQLEVNQEDMEEEQGEIEEEEDLRASRREDDHCKPTTGIARKLNDPILQELSTSSKFSSYSYSRRSSGNDSVNTNLLRYNGSHSTLFYTRPL